MMSVDLVESPSFWALTLLNNEDGLISIVLCRVSILIHRCDIYSDRSLVISDIKCYDATSAQIDTGALLVKI
jgi:hypothetical protein